MSECVFCDPLELLDLSSAFGLLVQWPEDPQEKLLVFRLETDSCSSKSGTVQHLAKLMADAHFSTDPVRPTPHLPHTNTLSLSVCRSSSLSAVLETVSTPSTDLPTPLPYTEPYSKCSSTETSDTLISDLSVVFARK